MMRSNSGLQMNKGRIIFVTALTVVVAVILSIFIGHTISNVNKNVRQSCFDELADTANQLADELNTAIGSDHTTLSAIAEIIAKQDTNDDKEVLKILNSFEFSNTYISYLQVLRPDLTMIYADGTVRDVSAYFNFAEEAQKGEYLSDMEKSTRNPDINIVRHAAPIKRNGEVVSILYGTVLLTDLSEKYKTNLYDGHCYVYIEDGDTGDFVLDTWHKTQGNIMQLGERQIIYGGKSISEAIDDMRNGISGETGFISRTTGGVLYMRYAPLGVNNWNVMLTVEEEYALAESEYTSHSLYTMALVIGAVLLLYIVSVIVCMYFAYRQVKQLAMQDQSTGLQNRNTYLQHLDESQDKTFDLITCVYADVNGLHQMNNENGHESGDKMLMFVADTMREVFDYHTLYRIGGDEFVAFSETDNENACIEKMKNVTKKLDENGYSISFGIVTRRSETGLKRITREADSEMLKNKSSYYMEHDRRNQT